MYQFVTADTHFGHANIIQYTNRPFKNIEDMDRKLVHFWNQRVKEGDTVYMLGDFCFAGGREGGHAKPAHFETQLKGRIVHIQGNHDANNGVKSLITEARGQYSGHSFLMTHEPPAPDQPLEGIEFVLCGHVHTHWKHRIIQRGQRSILVINVGVDLWNYRPVRIDEAFVYGEKILREEVTPP